MQPWQLSFILFSKDCVIKNSCNVYLVFGNESFVLEVLLASAEQEWKCCFSKWYVQSTEVSHLFEQYEFTRWTLIGHSLDVMTEGWWEIMEVKPWNNFAKGLRKFLDSKKRQSIWEESEKNWIKLLWGYVLQEITLKPNCREIILLDDLAWVQRLNQMIHYDPAWSIQWFCDHSNSIMKEG